MSVYTESSPAPMPNYDPRDQRALFRLGSLFAHKGDSAPRAGQPTVFDFENGLPDSVLEKSGLDLREVRVSYFSGSRSSTGVGNPMVHISAEIPDASSEAPVNKGIVLSIGRGGLRTTVVNHADINPQHPLARVMPEGMVPFDRQEVKELTAVIAGNLTASQAVAENH